MIIIKWLLLKTGNGHTVIPGSLCYTTTTDGGSADIAGANICPPIHGHTHTTFPGSLCHTAHPWAYAHHLPWLSVPYRPSMGIKNASLVTDWRF